MLLQCQGLLDKYNHIKETLLNQVQSKRDKSLGDLEALESWLGQVYTLLCLEPSKLWTSSSALSPWHQPRNKSPDPQGGTNGDQLSQPSDDSIMDGTDVSPAGGLGLDKSVNPDLMDSQYMKEVDHMVFSSPSEDGEEDGEEKASSVDDMSTVCGSEVLVTAARSLAEELVEAGFPLSPPPPPSADGFDGGSPLDLVELSPDVQEGSRDLSGSLPGSGGVSHGGSPDFKGLSQQTPPDDVVGLSQGTSPNVLQVSHEASPDLMRFSQDVSPDLKSPDLKSPDLKSPETALVDVATSIVKRELFIASPDHPHDLEEVDHVRKSHVTKPLSVATPLIMTSEEDGTKKVEISAKDLMFVRLKHSVDCEEVGKISGHGDTGLVSHDLEVVLNKLKVGVMDWGGVFHFIHVVVYVLHACFHYVQV